MERELHFEQRLEHRASSIRGMESLPARDDCNFVEERHVGSSWQVLYMNVERVD